MMIETLTVGGFAMNCYLVYDDNTRAAVFIDPGAEADRLIAKVEELELSLKFIINTHGHIDHVAEISQVMNHFNIPFYIHAGDQQLLASARNQGALFGISVSEIPKVTRYVEEGDRLNFADYECLVIHTPGHSPGSISIKIGANIFVGDCLFQDSIGRTDLPGGNMDQLLNSIKSKLFSLDDTVKVYPGHGPPTSIGREKMYNPFLKGQFGSEQ
jgi:glyoxylase-like metal-dependent hydrolase (beta-lactamase superfamily II)